VAAECVSKIISTVMNVAGIAGVVIGLAETQQLHFRDPEMKKKRFQRFYSWVLWFFDRQSGFNIVSCNGEAQNAKKL